MNRFHFRFGQLTKVAVIVAMNLLLLPICHSHTSQLGVGLAGGVAGPSHPLTRKGRGSEFGGEYEEFYEDEEDEDDYFDYTSDEDDEYTDVHLEDFFPQYFY